MKTIKVLSVRQPWAWLICAGYKNVENRSWKTNYRGRLYIHAAKSFDWNAIEHRICYNFPYSGWQLAYAHFGIKDNKITRHQEDFGAIVGYADLVDVKCGKGMKEMPSRFWAIPGFYHWELEYAAKLAPIPLKGRLGIFEIPEPEAIR